MATETQKQLPKLLQMQTERKARETVGSCLHAEGHADQWFYAHAAKYRRVHSALGVQPVWFVAVRPVTEATAKRRNAVHAPKLSGALLGHGERTHEPMPEDSTVLIPRDRTMLCATGERVCIEAGAVLHERVGDPDMIDSRYHYTVRITDPELVARTEKFIAAARKKETA